MDLTSHRPLNRIIERAVDKSSSNPSPHEFERVVMSCVSDSSLIRDGDLDTHLDLQREISERLDIDLGISSRKDSPQEIWEQTKRWVTEWCKRDGLHRVRRRYYTKK